MWENLGRTFGESFRLRTIADEKRIRFEPKEQLEEIIRGGPCVVCGMHLGNWELVAYARQAHGRPVQWRLSAPSNPLVDEEAATASLPL
jgi:KDO2-lipid IV(A) lauroyltransferase